MKRILRHDAIKCLFGFGLTALLLTVIQPPIGFSLLAWIAYVPFIWTALNCQRKLTLYTISYIIATLYWLGNVYWIGYVTAAGWIGFGFYTALLWPLLILLIRHCRKLKVPLIISVPLLIVGAEHFQGFLLGGFYWRHLAHSQYANITLIQIADIFGAAGVSFLVAIVNGCICDIILSTNKQNKKICAIIETPIIIVLLFATLLYGDWRIGQADSVTEQGPVVGAVQSNLPQSVKDSESFGVNNEVFTGLLNLSDKCKSAGAELVVWPETIIPEILDKKVWPYLPESRSNIHFHQALCSHAAEGIYLIVGSPGGEISIVDEYTVHLDQYNSAFLYLPSGRQAAENYDKIHLVPFGEVMPFKNSVPLLYKIFMLFSPYDFDYSLEAGTEFKKFTMHSRSANRDYRFSVIICYEGAMPHIARKFLLDEDGQKRIDWLVNISNDGWFVRFDNGKVLSSTELPQHTAVCAFRAVENRVSVLRSVNTGISCLIDPVGRIRDGYLAGNLPNEAMARTGMAGWFADRVPIDARVTIFSRSGPLLQWICRLSILVVVILLLSWPIIRHIKSGVSKNDDKKK